MSPVGTSTTGSIVLLCQDGFVFLADLFAYINLDQKVTCSYQHHWVHCITLSRSVS